MDTFSLAMDFIEGFIFNWTTYCWSIPAFLIAFTIFIKWGQGYVMVSDLPPLIFMSLINPIWYMLITIAIVGSPAILLFAFFYSIKDKKIF